MSLIKFARNHTGLHQGEFGELLGTIASGTTISQSRISEYESGKVAPCPKVRAAATPWAARELMRQLADAPKSAIEQLIIEAML